MRLGHHSVPTNYEHMPICKVWIYRLLFIYLFVCLFVCKSLCVYVCTVTDFSAEDNASGVKFCTAVHRRPASKAGILPLWGTLLPQKPKIGRTGSDESPASSAPWLPRAHMRAGQPWRRRRGRAHGPRVGSACVDVRLSPKTDIFVSMSISVKPLYITVKQILSTFRLS